MKYDISGTYTLAPTQFGSVELSTTPSDGHADEVSLQVGESIVVYGDVDELCYAVTRTETGLQIQGYRSMPSMWMDPDRR